MRYPSWKSIKNTTFPRLINTFLLKSTMAPLAISAGRQECMFSVSLVYKCFTTRLGNTVSHRRALEC